MNSSFASPMIMHYVYCRTFFQDKPSQQTFLIPFRIALPFTSHRYLYPSLSKRQGRQDTSLLTTDQDRQRKNISHERPYRDQSDFIRRHCRKRTLYLITHPVRNSFFATLQISNIRTGFSRQRQCQHQLWLPLLHVILPSIRHNRSRSLQSHRALNLRTPTICISLQF